MAEGIKVDLTDFEYKAGMNLAIARYNSYAEAYPTGSRTRTASDDYMKAYRVGCLAELAVCKHFNVYPEISGGQDNTSYDCVINGKKVDVKASDFHNARLLVEAKNGDASTADIYVFAVVIDRSVWIKGFAYHDEVVQPHRLGELRPNHPSYIMEQSDDQFHKFNVDR